MIDMLSNVFIIAEFSGIGLLIAILVMFLLKYTPVQHLVLPFYDELKEMARRLTSSEPKDKISQADSYVALALAVVSAATILGVLLFLADVITFFS